MRTEQLHVVRLAEPTDEMAAIFQKWENDPKLVPFIRPNQTKEDLHKPEIVTRDTLLERIKHHVVYLIYKDDTLIGEMDYQVDPPHLYKKEAGTAWIGINIGEESGRGKGNGRLALAHLEKEIREAGLHRIELGVFEFNANAIKLYTRSGYTQIGVIPDFTYWRGKLWSDIRMEKYVN